MNKLNKGITLVALVITIIILIILAGITMSILFGEGGLINKAGQGVERYSDESNREKIQLAAITASANTNARFDKDIFRTQLNEYFGEGNYTLSIDDETGLITVIVDEKVYTLTASGSLLDGTGTIPYDPANDSSYGNDTSSHDWSSSTGTEAKLDLGETVNLRLKKIAALANGVSEDVLDTWTVYNSEDTYIRCIEWTDSEPSAENKGKYGQLAMTSDSVLGMDSDGATNELIVSGVPIWAWYDGGTIYIWSSDSTIDMHPHSERMFQGMKRLDNIGGLTHFKSDAVETMRCMFSGCDIGYYGFSPIDNWNISNVKISLKAGQESLPGNNGFYKIANTTTNPVKPDFSERPGLWDSEGTYFPGSTRCMAYSIRDEVQVGGDNFYVIENCTSEQNTIKLLAKYPLNKPGTAQVSNLDDDYKVAFSSTYYWANEWAEYYNPDNYNEEDWDSYLNKPKGAQLNINPIEGYSNGDAIDKAKKYAAAKNATDGRLLTCEEFSALGNTSLNEYRNSVLVDSNYWLGSAMNYVNGSSHYGSNQFLKTSIDWLQGSDYTESTTYGVRPILTAPRSEMTLVHQYT